MRISYSNFKNEFPGILLQVVGRLVAPLPSPYTVAMQPARLLQERASKAGYHLNFVHVTEAEQTFTVHAFINAYLLARFLFK